ncbi:MAG: polysaccharide deacetylase family protein [Nanoarchaeota archaeon]|nr:polysaccharide deacetylase family protein [Nanoarchaeota archaeon]
MKNRIFLTFDLEEFDLPKEYGYNISEDEMYNVSLNGLGKLLKLLDKYNARATFFVTANFAMKYQEMIKELSKNNEIASHSVSHSSFAVGDLKKSKVILEKIIGKEVRGFRMPRLRKINLKEIIKAGYTYDSSLNPTFIPGRYNNLSKKRFPHYKDNLLIIPTSVTPIIRFPIFWLDFKILPLFFFKFLSKINLVCDKYLHLYFHPWEFADLSKFNIPWYIRFCDDKRMVTKFEKYLRWLKTQGEFSTLYDMEGILSQ